MFFMVSNGGVIKYLGLVNVYSEGFMSYTSTLAKALGSGGNIQNCFATGRVMSYGGYAGGLIGHSHATTTIKNCYAKVDVQGLNNYCAGLLGTLRGKLQNCYCVGQVTGPNRRGLVGTTQGVSFECINSYYDRQVTGFSSTAVGTSRTTAQMTHPYSSTYIGWDFENIWNADQQHQINDGYPYLFEYTKDQQQQFLGFNIYRDGIKINEYPILQTQYIDNNVQAGIQYTYYVTAVYVEGQSGPSNEVTVATQFLQSPRNLIAMPKHSAVDLQWEQPMI